MSRPDPTAPDRADSARNDRLVQADPPTLPAATIAALKERAVNPDQLREVGKFGLPRAVRRFVSRSGTVVLEFATGQEGIRCIGRELFGRSWARQHGIGCPQVYASDPGSGWLVGEWLSADTKDGPATGTDYIEEALETANRIAAAPSPTGGPPMAEWRSSRLTAAVRIARGFRAGIPTRLWWRTRAAVESVPRVPVAHNDFYHRNVLWRADRAAGSRICVVDWEYLGEGPRYGDALRMWVVLPTREQRDLLLDRVLSAAPAEHRPEIALLALWLAIRLIGENVKTPRRFHNPADIAHAWEVLPEATELARKYGVYPG